MEKLPPLQQRRQRQGQRFPCWTQQQLRLLVVVVIFFLSTNSGTSFSWCTVPSSRSIRTTTSLRSSLNNNDDPVLRLPLMEAELAAATTTMSTTSSTTSDNNENNIQELQESIDNAKLAAEFGVRKAQAEFYHAFSTGDYEAMNQVWSSSNQVRCVHPGMSSLEGREAVMESWQGFLNNNAGTTFQIEPKRVQIEICGTTALCSCIEETEGGKGQLEALNVYKRENGAWKMTLHMASPILMRPGTQAFF